ncbi:N-succinyl-L,L-diaminopimelate desuccinylase [Candidatus Pelagibacter sp. IMCC9063]|uniref:succinyl-diaminopimelate desuccinylase n=1 Tax=Pelagibacter sp. (strain IMCC9063) TaxID=1002672 RepID=UPI0002046889|nr:succinyl-diaminopimelate desuccinylase [Candidatus Pelagibacter sp. IMCC9063]AEA81017.1 N-succinyl-L,L-diaminopimelate desuccinylase [Candidatus Pelagibacter sp. IMCC9063]
MAKIINELSFTKELIKIPSVTPIDAGAIDLVTKRLKSLGFKCTILNFKDKNTPPIKNLYARLGTSSPNFCFAGHTDVVPTGNAKSWDAGPFSGIVKNGKIYGRGASDMKGGIACFIAAVSEFIKDQKKFKGSISFIITGDEEGVAINGTKKVVNYLKKKKEKIDFCIVGEPSNRKVLGQMMKIGRRGSITTHLTLSGIQGHVAYPHEACNPSTPLIKILDKLKSTKLDNGTNNFQPSNLEITKIGTDSHADNVIPATSSATFNIRFNNKHNHSSLKKKISTIVQTIAKKYKCKPIVKFSETGTAFITKPGETVRMMSQVIKKITNKKPVLSTSGGTSDARFIKDIAPCVEFGLVGNTMHKINECVSVNDLKKLKKIYYKVLETYFK